MSDIPRQFGSFLRARRERTGPEMVGLSDSRRRRTPGLRREEVALLAGISTEWYIKLEQGRAAAPSFGTIEALARALRFDRAEQAHLHALASRAIASASRTEQVPTALRRLVESLPHPAYVLGQRWDMLAYNAAAAGLFDELTRPQGERNVLRFTLTTPAGRRLFGAGWSAEARRMVALFRSTFDLHADDPGFLTLLDHLRSGCPEFSEWWTSHMIGSPESGSKLLHPRTGGAVRYDYTTLQSNDDPQLKLVSYTATDGNEDFRQPHEGN